MPRFSRNVVEVNSLKPSDAYMLTIIGADSALSPGRRQAIIWTNARILLIGPLGTIFVEILIGFQIFSYKKMHLKMSSAKWRPFCLGLDVLRYGWMIIFYGKLWIQLLIHGFIYGQIRGDQSRFISLVPGRSSNTKKDYIPTLSW